MGEIEDRLDALEAQVELLRPDIPRFGVAELRRQLAPLRATITGAELLRRGALVLPSSAGARSDTTADFEVNAYISGSMVVLQVFDRENNAWRVVEMT